MTKNENTAAFYCFIYLLFGNLLSVSAFHGAARLNYPSITNSSALGKDASPIRQIPVFFRPEVIAVSPDGPEVWIGHSGDGSIIDAQSLTVKKTFKAGYVSLRLTFMKDGQRGLAADPKGGELIIFDAKSRAEVKRIASPVSFALSADEKRDFVSLVHASKAGLVDLENGTVLVAVLTGVPPDDIVWIDNRH